MNDQREPGSRPEHDDFVNPTSAAPGDDWGREQPQSDDTWRRDERAGRDDPTDDGPSTGSGRARGWSTSEASAGAQQFLSQLQSMIDNIATQSAPVVREISAKAAELAAVAAERAGPLAQRAAEKTQEVGSRVAERSRGLAEELRRQQEARTATGGGEGGGGGSGTDDDADDTTAPTGPTV